MNHKLTVQLSRLLQYRNLLWHPQFQTVCRLAATYSTRTVTDRDVRKHEVKTVTRQFSCTPTCMANIVRKNKLKNDESLTRKGKSKILMKNPVVSIYFNMTVKQLADSLNKSTDDIFEVLLYVDGGNRYEETFSVIDDIKVIQSVVKLCGMRFKRVSSSPKPQIVKEKENCDVVRQPAPDESVLQKRSPVVTIMGHVDHGKTTLLDCIRKSKIVDQEFGGITQHIGAFSVKLVSGEMITFLDTPGHAAFSAMRARGAQVTDIVVLVVAADDGVMEQTLESIQHATKANVPVIVAINKIDKENADLERTKKMLLQHQIVIEEFGGDIQVVPISALLGRNIKELQECIVTLSEMMELKADPVGFIEGRIIEAKTDPGRGRLATAVVQRGTLKKGTILVAGNTWAKVRGMFDDNGKPIQSAPPSTAVQIIGWRELPSAGDEILQVESEKIARSVIDYRLNMLHEIKHDEDQIIINEKRSEHQKMFEGELKFRREKGIRRLKRKKEKEIIINHEGPQLSLVLKGDVDGSLEAILDVLDSYNSKKCRLDLLHYGVGNITEQDVKMAESFDGMVYGFNVIAPVAIRNLAKASNVPISVHNVIYKLFEDLHVNLSSKLPVIEEEDTVGEAQVLKVFHVTSGKKKITVAGCRCIKGLIIKKKKFHVIRGQEVVYEGPIESLKHIKNEVESIKLDVECGISLGDRAIEFKIGDIIQCLDVRQVTQVIDWDPGF